MRQEIPAFTMAWRLSGSLLLCTSAGQDVLHAVISFVTGVLEHRLLTLRHGNLYGPRPRPRFRIIDRELIKERVGVDPGEPLDKMQHLAGCPEGAPEIPRVDDQRVAFPVAPRIPHPLADRRPACGRPSSGTRRWSWIISLRIATCSRD